MGDLRQVPNRLKSVLEQLGAPKGKSLSEQLDAGSIANTLQDALLAAGWHFSEVTVPDKAKGEIIIRGTKDDQFIDVAISYRQDMADVEVSTGKIAVINDLTSHEDIVQTVMGFASGELAPAAPMVRERMREQPPPERKPGWMGLKDRPRRLGSSLY